MMKSKKKTPRKRVARKQIAKKPVVIKHDDLVPLELAINTQAVTSKFNLALGELGNFEA